LWYLSLENNQLQYIPVHLDKLQSLTVCSMNSNPFSCPIPEWTRKYCGANCSSNSN